MQFDDVTYCFTKFRDEDRDLFSRFAPNLNDDFFGGFKEVLNYETDY